MSVNIINKSDLPLPKYETEGASGMDLMANIDEKIILSPFKRVLVPTGLYIELPSHLEAQVRARSGLAIKYGVTVINGIGTIDSDYRGEIRVPLINLGEKDFIINKGDRIAQLIISEYVKVKWNLVEDLNHTDRGENGFGSTGI
ncbi:deoxyuridine 5'-triphosphate nucleotidohydrolase [Caminicella sporogenes]|nr:deoxyuridine 5'-triphosphate nucleotidohydrolase [Caminicella sporogenes]